MAYLSESIGMRPGNGAGSNHRDVQALFRHGIYFNRHGGRLAFLALEISDRNGRGTDSARGTDAAQAKMLPAGSMACLNPDLVRN